MNALLRDIQHPLNKAKFIRWEVYMANVALMVGENIYITSLIVDSTNKKKYDSPVLSNNIINITY